VSILALFIRFFFALCYSLGNVAATQYGTGVISSCFSNEKVRVGDIVMKNYAISGLFR
jgi:hypothetical protein